MKQIEDDRTIEIAMEPKKGRGRPRNPDALTGAERARRFRAAHSKTSVAPSPVPVTDLVTEKRELVTEKEFEELKRAEATRTLHLQAAHAEARLLADKIADLQMKLDFERQARIDAERRLATLKAKTGK